MTNPDINNKYKMSIRFVINIHFVNNNLNCFFLLQSLHRLRLDLTKSLFAVEQRFFIISTIHQRFVKG